MAKASDVINYAISQEGYEEPNHDNRTKYGEMMDTVYSGFFNGKKNGFDWCCVFVCCAFCVAYSKAVALKLLNLPAGNLAAVVKYFFDYMKRGGMTGSVPKKGAVVFFQNNKGLSHVGIVIDFDDEYITTIEGNAGPGSYFVKRNKYRREVTYIYGYGYPKYEVEPVPLPKYQRDGIYTVKVKELNLRTGAGLDKDVLMTLHKGDKVHCLKVVKEDGRTWLRVDGYACGIENGDIYLE